MSIFCILSDVVVFFASFALAFGKKRVGALRVTFEQYKNNPSDSVTFSHTPPWRLASCIASHAFIVPGINATSYFPALFLCLRQAFIISSAQRSCSSEVGASALQGRQSAQLGWRSLQSGKSPVIRHVTDYYLSGLTQQLYSSSLLYPGALRMVVCHDVFPIVLRVDKVALPFPSWDFLNLCHTSGQPAVIATDLLTEHRAHHHGFTAALVVRENSGKSNEASFSLCLDLGTWPPTTPAFADVGGMHGDALLAQVSNSLTHPDRY